MHELLYCLELDLLENTKYDGTTFFRLASE